jgi:hypothetical protein
MNAQTPSNPISTALRNSTSILEIMTTALGTGRTDKQKSSDLDASAHAVVGTSRLVVDRLTGAKGLHNAFKNVHKEVRENAFAMTTRWGENSQRLLVNVNLERWAVRHKQLVVQHDELLEELEKRVDDIIAAVHVNLGEYAQRIDPPTREEMLSAYSVRHKVSPFPDDRGFDNFPPETAALLKKQFEDDAAAAFRAGQAEKLKELAVPVEYLIKRLETYDQVDADFKAGKEVGRGEGTFRESSVENVQNVLAVLPSLNILGDPRIDALVDRLKLLMGVSAKDLKSNDDLRAKALADMKSAFADSLLPGVN